MTNSRVASTGSAPTSPVADSNDRHMHTSSVPGVQRTNGDPAVPADARGPGRSLAIDETPRFRPELLRINDAVNPGGFIARDFEQAVVDEDFDEKRSPGMLSGVDDWVAKQGSHSPGVARRGTVGRGQNQDRAGRSRTSSSSSRSTSPPNSVEAFAEPRRRERANTIGSRAPSDIDVVLHRTVSGGTHRRRPTFSDHPHHPDILNDTASKLGDREDDGFQPSEDLFRACTIDFEALEEFVTENEELRAQGHGRRPRGCSHGSQPHFPRRMFNDLRPGKQTVPQIVKRPASQSVDATHDHPVIIDMEKNSDSDADVAESDSGTPFGQVDSNRYSFFSSELDSTVHATDIGDLLMPGESFRDLFRQSPEGGVWWLDVLNPTDDEINAITKAFSIHPLTSEDIKTQEAREKVELFKKYYFVCFRSFFQVDKKSEDYMEPVNVYVVVFREGAISFTYCNSPHGPNVRKRIGKLRDDISNSLSSDWICYAMIDDIVDSFGPVIHEIERETDMIEDSVFVARAIDRGALLRQIGECRKKVMGLMRLLGGKADVIKGFAKRCNEQYSVTPRGEIGLYLGDIQDHLVTMMSNLSHFEMMLSRSHSNYLAQLQVDNIAQGTRANEVLSKMTMIATILVPLNLISGLFGMNVPVPGHESSSLGWFFGILGIIISIAFCSVCILKKFRYV